jgi:hypothetical protein
MTLHLKSLKMGLIMAISLFYGQKKPRLAKRLLLPVRGYRFCISRFSLLAIGMPSFSIIP